MERRTASSETTTERPSFDATTAVSWTPTEPITDPRLAYIPRRLTGTRLEELIKTAADHRLAMAPTCRTEDGHIVIEQAWTGERMETEELLPQQGCALQPVGLSSKDRTGTPVPPHLRCHIFVRESDRFSAPLIWVDVFVPDCQVLEPLDRLTDVAFTCFARRVTGAQFGDLIGLAVEHGLNRALPWREEGGRGLVESGGEVWADIGLDQEYVLFPHFVHLHRMGQPAPPHWRCSLYAPDGRERIVGYLDVLVPEFDALPIVEW